MVKFARLMQSCVRTMRKDRSLVMTHARRNVEMNLKSMGVR